MALLHRLLHTDVLANLLGHFLLHSMGNLLTLRNGFRVTHLNSEGVTDLLRFFFGFFYRDFFANLFLFVVTFLNFFLSTNLIRDIFALLFVIDNRNLHGDIFAFGLGNHFALGLGDVLANLSVMIFNLIFWNFIADFL